MLYVLRQNKNVLVSSLILNSPTIHRH